MGSFLSSIDWIRGNPDDNESINNETSSESQQTFGVMESSDRASSERYEEEWIISHFLEWIRHYFGSLDARWFPNFAVEAILTLTYNPAGTLDLKFSIQPQIRSLMEYPLAPVPGNILSPSLWRISFTFTIPCGNQPFMIVSNLFQRIRRYFGTLFVSRFPILGLVGILRLMEDPDGTLRLTASLGTQGRS